jgi:lysyl-tRNA synthetase class 2
MDIITNENLSLNEVIKLRRDKLKELREKNKDPFKIDRFERTAHSMQIKEDYQRYEGKEEFIAIPCLNTEKSTGLP